MLIAILASLVIDDSDGFAEVCVNARITALEVTQNHFGCFCFYISKCSSNDDVVGLIQGVLVGVHDAGADVQDIRTDLPFLFSRMGVLCRAWICLAFFK